MRIKTQDYLLPRFQKKQNHSQKSGRSPESSHNEDAQTMRLIYLLTHKDFSSLRCVRNDEVLKIKKALDFSKAFCTPQPFGTE